MTFDERAARQAPTELPAVPPRRRAPRWLVLLVSVVALLAVVAVVVARLALSSPMFRSA